MSCPIRGEKGGVISLSFRRKLKGGRERTGHGMVPTIFRSNTAVAIAVKARHWRLREEREGFFEDWGVC